MAVKDARKAATKKPTYANTAGSSSSVAMAEMPPHGANHVQPPPPPPLPPGVYFSPTRMECLGLLNRWIAGDNEMPERDTWGCVRRGNIYGESPDALRQQHPPASVRERESTWWFLSQTRFQSKTAGGGTSKRADRKVETGGYWRLEQSKEELKEKLEQSKEKMKAEGVKNCFGYYVDGHSKSKKKDKTPWLMQEFTSANDDGAGKRGVPALYRVYVTPHATDEQLTDLFGEDGVKYEPDGKKKKPARTMVPELYFDRIAALLPEGSARGVMAQEHAPAQAPLPTPPPAPEGLLEYHSQQEQYQHDMYLGQHEQQQGQYLGPYQYQQDQYLGQYEQQQQQQYEQNQYISQYEQQQHQHEQEQQQGPSSMVAPPLPPPASPGLLAELAADVPSDNLSMSMADIMRMIDEPAEMVIEQPAVTINREEPNWESFDNIVDDDELANFNK